MAKLGEFLDSYVMMLGWTEVSNISWRQRRAQSGSLACAAAAITPLYGLGMATLCSTQFLSCFQSPRKSPLTQRIQGQGALSQAAAHSPACAATTRRLPKVFQTGRRWKSSPITCGVIFQKKILSVTSNKPFKWGTQTQRHPSRAYAALPVDWTNVAHLPVAGLSLEVECDKWRVKSINSSVLQIDAWGCGKNSTTGRWEAYCTWQLSPGSLPCINFTNLPSLPSLLAKASRIPQYDDTSGRSCAALNLSNHLIACHSQFGFHQVPNHGRIDLRD